MSAAELTSGRPARAPRAARAAARAAAATAAAAAAVPAAVRAAPGARWNHSRFVGLTKVILPVLALMLIAAVSIWPNLRPEDLSFRIGFAAIETGGSAEPSIINPRYFGTDGKNQAYSVTADLARGGASAQTVELEMPKADIALEDGTWLVLTSDTGGYTRKDKSLNLAGDVNLFHDSGFEFRTSAARIDLEAGLADGAEAVEGHGPFGEVTAEGFRLLDKGRVIHFKGRSRLVIYPAAARPLH